MITDKEIIELEERLREELYCNCRNSFFKYCNTIAPNFYKKDRQFLIDLCNEFQDFYESKDDILIINEPPRHGKSRTASMFTQWVLGKNRNEKIMTGSYNETLSTTFSKSVRNAILEEKADDNITVYNDIFKGTTIKRGDGAMNLWALEGGYNNYLATSPTGTATGFGCSIMIIDDLIKNSEDAYNENVKEKHWDWFCNTMLSRLEEGGKIIIIMTRWASDDLAGKALGHFEEEHKKVRHINLKALNDDGTMLCDEILSKESYNMKVRAMGEDIASANYQQVPIDIKGKLYEHFKNYDELPENIERVSNYTDTADEGSDFLCSITYAELKGEAYVTDVVYTQASMEVTENLVAKMFKENKVNLANIESNNGGKGFARMVQLKLKELNHNGTVIKWFHQSKNKKARILSNSTWVMEHIYMPTNWKNKWPEFYKDLNKYQRTGKNKHDDSADAITGVAEKMEKNNVIKTINRSSLF